MLFKNTLIALILCAFFGYCKNEDAEDKTARTYGLVAMAQSSAATNASATCKNCHSETSELGRKILWAKEGWDESVHKNGYKGALWTKTGSNCSYNSTTKAWTCTDGTKPTFNDWSVIGYEWHGSDAFYSNGGGCQRCHTHEGFREFVETYNLNTTNYDAAIGTAAVKWPSNIGCFTCHSPHTNGSFDLLVKNGTTVTTNIGTTYNKAKGSLCASCHQIRGPSSTQTVNDYLIAALKGSGISTRSTAHHGPQADVLMGKGGAQEPSSTYGAYSNSRHTTETGADCITCHQVYDSNTSTAERYGLSAAVGGHAFAVTGIVHGAESAIAIGCATSGCHTVPTGSTANSSFAKKATTDDGMIRKGDAYLQTGSSAYYTQLNTTFKALANPDDVSGSNTGCTGLLSKAATAAGTKITWATLADGVTIDPRCDPSSLTTLKDSSAGNDSNSTRFARAYWNFMLVKEDKSKGVHNYKYLSELLYDSCEDLKKILSDTTTSCGTRP